MKFDNIRTWILKTAIALNLGPIVLCAFGYLYGMADLNKDIPEVVVYYLAVLLLLSCPVISIVCFVLSRNWEERVCSVFGIHISNDFI
ncbi:hypothetical protein ACFL2H_00285 [Planctomycetota bacterium]